MSIKNDPTFAGNLNAEQFKVYIAWNTVSGYIGYYTSDEEAPTTYSDYLLCKRDAECGNERAKKHMAALAEFRLTGKVSDGMPFVIVMHWRDVQRRMGSWYKALAVSLDYTVYADYLHCKRDAELGNERAKEYMAALAELRLTGE